MPQWNPPAWARQYRKHWPCHGTDWRTVVKRTERSASKYHSDLSLAMIEQMELGAVTAGGVEFPSRIANERWFFRRFDRVIGACNGELVTTIFVRYSYTGDVHGYPITDELLRKKGASV